MEVVHRICAGLDVHKRTVMACVRVVETSGTRERVAEFATDTREILRMGDWLAEHGVTHIAMESTGVYWKPIYNLLEERFSLTLCNAQHIQQVPGRKTDVKDCQWIAQLLQHGLVRNSFVPPSEIRVLRDLTRMRAQLTAEKTSAVNRIHKVLEDANLKLASVATDIMGKSGRDMLRAIIDGKPSAVEIAKLARGKMRSKLAALEAALEGRVTEHHRFLLTMLLEHIESLDQRIGSFSDRIVHVMKEADVKTEAKLPFATAVQLLTTIPGIKQVAAENIVAEIGTDMTRFPTAHHLASWSGLCPGNHESAGKRKSGKTRKGSRWLRRTLAQAAWAASRSKRSYLAAQYRRLATRRGNKRAVVAVAHSILTIVYQLLAHGQTYHDLGANHFDRIDPQRVTHNLVRRLERLGHKVTLQTAA